MPASRNDLDLAIRAAEAAGIRATDICAFVCSDEVLPVDFRGRLEPATVAALDRITAEIARPGDTEALLFLATNHGAPSGLYTATRIDELDPDEPVDLTSPILGNHLDRIRCPQVVVIAACYAGTFLNIAHEGRLVLTACNAEEIIHVESDVPRTAFLCELLGHWTGVVLPGFVDPPDRLPPDEAFDAAKVKLAADYRTTKPHRAGSVIWPR